MDRDAPAVLRCETCGCVLRMGNPGPRCAVHTGTAAAMFASVGMGPTRRLSAGARVGGPACDVSGTLDGDGIGEFTEGCA